MKHFHGTANVGLRNTTTDKLVAVYPHQVNETDKNIESDVKYWYYQQSCTAEEELRELYVDLLNEQELNK